MADESSRPKTFSSVRALVMSQMAQHVGEKFDDPGLKKAGQGLEVRAVDAIKAGKPNLDPMN